MGWTGRSDVDAAGGPRPSVHVALLWRRVNLALVATALLLGLGGWDHYRRLSSWADLPMTGPDYLALGWMLWAASLKPFVPVLLAAGLLSRIGARRTAHAVWLLGAAGLLVWRAIDMRVQATTGNHALDYLQFAGDPAAWKWGGDPGCVVVWLAVTACACLAAVVIGDRLCAWYVRGVTSLCPGLGGWRSGVAAGALFACALAGFFPARAVVSSPFIVERVEMVLPDRPPGASLLPARHRELQAFHQELGALLSDAYAAAGPDLADPPNLDRRRFALGEAPPNVLVVMVESLRRDALCAESMPRLHAWSRRGLRLERHYAGGNCSHLGVFSFLYSRSPLVYTPVLDAHMGPQFCETLRRADYSCSYFTTETVQWMRMNEFLRPPFFDRVNAYLADSPSGGDRVACRAARHQLGRPGPQFVMVFPVSTHFPYWFPPEYERHRPVLPWRRGLEVTPAQRPLIHNRYKNALKFLDDEVAALLEEIDPARTLVVFTGDHGESFFDDGTLGHSSKLSEAQTRVPFVLAGPGVRAGAHEGATTHADVLPTLLHVLAGRDVGLRHTHGRDLFAGPAPDQAFLCTQGLAGGPLDGLLIRGPDRLALSVCINPPALRVVGLFDAQARYDLAQTDSAHDARDWARAAREEWGRMRR